MGTTGCVRTDGLRTRSRREPRRMFPLQISVTQRHKQVDWSLSYVTFMGCPLCRMRGLCLTTRTMLFFGRWQRRGEQSAMLHRED